MRGLILVLLALAFIGIAAGVSARENIRTAQTSGTTTCMMGCNSQYANCQSSCFATGGLPSSPAVGGPNANINQTCVSSCTNQQLQCQIVCSRTISR